MSAMNNQKIAVLRGSALPGIRQGGTFLAFSLLIFFLISKWRGFSFLAEIHGLKKV
jgi:hypothetical protein